MQRGDLITVALQGDAGKPRPALVIQADHFTNLPTLVVLPLTSTILDLPLVRVTVEPSEGTGLPQHSQVIVSRPQFLPRGKAGLVIGRLDAATLLEVTRRLAVLLGIG
jgi:mRNA interferase MazF